MADITPQMVKDLRDKTGAGMGDCKKALQDATGDMQAAIDILRKKGAASVAKRADRSAKEGLVTARTTKDGKSGIIVEVNCETDFVAKNEAFVNYVNQVADSLMSNKVNTVEDLMNLSVGNDTILGLHNEILAKFGEKIEVRRFNRIDTTGFVTEYIHAGSKLAVLVEVSIANPIEEPYALIRDIAMQIAAMNPQYIERKEVTAAHLEKEKEIYIEAAIAEGKKPEIAERIASGRVEKFYQEQCLLEQTFVKDSNKIVKDVVREISGLCGETVDVKSFKRYYLGEELV